MIWTSLAHFMLRMISYGESHHLQHQRYRANSMKLNLAKIERLHQANFNASDVSPTATDIHLSERLSMMARLRNSLVSPNIFFKASVNELVFALHPLRPPRDPSITAFGHH